MMQHQASLPQDEVEVPACSRSASDRRQKTNVHVDQALNCPRCDSTNTKFCYFNNYSLTQPRHFCKNCRRYWTKGGTLRNVPVGGGCRKNKRIKHRTVDPSSLVSLDEATSSMLASINTSNRTPLLPKFSGPSSSSFVDLADDSHRFRLNFPHIPEPIRLGEHSGAVPSNPAVYGLSPESSQVTAGLINSSCSRSSLLNSLTSVETNLMNLSFPNCSVKTEPGVLYSGSDFSSLFETPAPVPAAATTPLPSSDDQLSSTYSGPAETFDESALEAQLRLQEQKLAAQLVNEGQEEDDGQMLRAFEDETDEHLRRVKEKTILPYAGDGRSLSDWQGVSENLFETAAESNFWSNVGWSDWHALIGSSAGAMTL